MDGTISNVVATKKFGFISGENGQEYFFHMTDVVNDWDDLASEFAKKGGGKVKVFFEAIKTPKGPRARNVTILDL